MFGFLKESEFTVELNTQNPEKSNGRGTFSFQMASPSNVKRYFVDTAAFTADLLCISPGHG